MSVERRRNDYRDWEPEKVVFVPRRLQCIYSIFKNCQQFSPTLMTFSVFFMGQEQFSKAFFTNLLPLSLNENGVLTFLQETLLRNKGRNKSMKKLGNGRQVKGVFGHFLLIFLNRECQISIVLNLSSGQVLEAIYSSKTNGGSE
jgi:hypothetical protein